MAIDKVFQNFFQKTASVTAEVIFNIIIVAIVSLIYSRSSLILPQSISDKRFLALQGPRKWIFLLHFKFTLYMKHKIT